MTKPLIHTHARGRGDQALLLINGWGASGLIWPRGWLQRLEECFVVIRPDNRGSGWSRHAPRPFGIATMADDAHAVLQACGFESAVVLGLSMGGMIAQELALRHPSAVDHLLLVATRPPAPAATAPNLRLLMRLARGPRSGQQLDDYLQTTWAQFAAPGFAQAHPEVMAELVAQIRRRPTRGRGVLDQMRAMSAWTGAHRLRHIEVPTTVIHGLGDPLIDVENGRILAKLIPSAGLIELPSVGHLVPHEAGGVLIEELRRATSRVNQHLTSR